LNTILTIYLIKKDNVGKISFTLDAWTSSNVISFLGITCHFIDSDWNLKDVLLDFIYLTGSHTGENIMKEFLKCTKDDFGILTKVIIY
jgi:hypothetical protein